VLAFFMLGLHGLNHTNETTIDLACGKRGLPHLHLPQTVSAGTIYFIKDETKNWSQEL
jgi:hypothetical protein